MIFNANNIIEILTLIIQFADDIDVGQLLLNANPHLVSRKPNTPITNRVLSNKELLLQKLCLANYEFYNSIEITTSDRIKHDKEKLDILTEHLKAISLCYSSYFLYCPNSEIDLSNIEDIISSDRLSIGKKQTISIEEYKHAGNLASEDIKKILHLIINNYKNYKFYYAINGDIINKIEIIHGKVTQAPFNITYAERTSYITNKLTGLKLNIGLPIKYFKVNKKGQVDVINKKFEDFSKLNNAIMTALAKEPKPCCYCYPDKNGKPERTRCCNCDEILEKLNHLQELKKARVTKTNKIKTINIEQGLRVINYTKYANVMTLRKARKLFLEEVLSNCKQYNNISFDMLNDIQTLINKGFGKI